MTVLLVVEDDAMMPSDFVSMIESAGIEVIEAAKADDAIAILVPSKHHGRLHRIETLGSMNGLNLAFAVGDRWPPMSIIIASGRICPQPDEMPSEVTFLRKPYFGAVALDAVHRAAA